MLFDIGIQREKMHFLSITDLKAKEIMELVKKGIEAKKRPSKYDNALKNKNLLILFEMPSLRTRLSFEVAMNQMGGHAVYYSISESTIGKKESIADFARVVSRYCDALTARIHSQKTLEKIAENSSIPVINALTSFEHPCQVLADFMTIYEKKRKLEGLKLAFVGDGNNNVTHSLLYGASLIGMDISVACPAGKTFSPQEKVVKEARAFAKRSGSKIEILRNPAQAVKGADAVYTDTWMSYRIPAKEKKNRLKAFRPFQVNKKLMGKAKKNALFMHCLPASRGYEVTDEVIDSRQSVVLDEAENRLHVQKALLFKLIK